jgi:hypothetical protein
MFSDHLSFWIDRFLVPIDDPGSRLFHMNILVSVAMIAGWWWFKHRSFALNKISNLIFRRRY